MVLGRPKRHSACLRTRSKRKSQSISLAEAPTMAHTPCWGRCGGTVSDADGGRARGGGTARLHFALDPATPLLGVYPEMHPQSSETRGLGLLTAALPVLAEWWVPRAVVVPGRWGGPSSGAPRVPTARPRGRVQVGVCTHAHECTQVLVCLRKGRRTSCL